MHITIPKTISYRREGRWMEVQTNSLNHLLRFLHTELIIMPWIITISRSFTETRRPILRHKSQWNSVSHWASQGKWKHRIAISRNMHKQKELSSSSPIQGGIQLELDEYDEGTISLLLSSSRVQLHHRRGRLCRCRHYCWVNVPGVSLSTPPPPLAIFT